MKRHSAILLFALISTQIAGPCCASQQAYIPEKFKGIILDAPEPDFPAMRYSNNMMFGTGVYRLVINQKSGAVDAVRVLRYIGYPRVDAAAIWALFRWKFRPGAIKQLDLPVEYGTTFQPLLRRAVTR
jgi:outer membrane biosynthesis protein TonB